jgi:recombination protein RecR
MADFPPAMQRLIAEFSRLPSIGEKSATRLAYYLLNSNRELAQSLSEALRKAVTAVRLCERCFFLSEEPLCAICRNPNRDNTTLCLVEKPMDLVAVERVGEYKGYYHVLHGLWAPLKGQGPESMRLKELIERVKAGGIAEVIIATSSTVEGDATAMYVARILGELGVKTSRLAQGIPKGGELEYSDEITLSRAFSGRSVISP